MLTVKQVIASSVVLASVASAQLAVATPPTIQTCVPVALTWSGGTAPYYVSIIPGGETTAANLIDFGTFTGTSYTWTDSTIAAGTQVTIKVTDSTGTTQYSAIDTIQSGSTSCFSSSSSSSGTASSSASTAASSAASSVAASASSAVSSAASSASSAASSASSAASSAVSSATSAAAASTSTTSKAATTSTAAATTSTATVAATSSAAAASSSAASGAKATGVAAFWPAAVALVGGAAALL